MRYFMRTDVPPGFEGLQRERAEDVAEAVEKLKKVLRRHGPQDETWRRCANIAGVAGGCDPRRPSGAGDLSPHVKKHQDELGEAACAATKKIGRYLKRSGVQDRIWWWCADWGAYFGGYDPLS